MVHERLLTSIGNQERSEINAPEKIKKHTCQEICKVWKCKWFLEKSVTGRIAFVSEKKFCFLCLQSGRLPKDCKMNLKCIKKGLTMCSYTLRTIENQLKVVLLGLPLKTPCRLVLFRELGQELCKMSKLA